MTAVRICTIGFTHKSARAFFGLLRSAGVTCVVDIRVHADGQLAGFTKSGDLAYFLEAILGCEYVHLRELAPTAGMMRAYRDSGDWPAFRAAYNALLDARGVPAVIDRALFERRTCCLLCSEAAPERCHRSLAAERLAAAWGEVDIIHL